MGVKRSRDEPEAPHPSTGLNDVVHQRTRLGILTVLAESRRADFTYLKATLGLSDGNLGRHLEILASEGLIEITKGYEGRRPRTWAEITRAGQSALAVQMAAMKELVSQYEGAVSSPAEGAKRVKATTGSPSTATRTQSARRRDTAKPSPKLAGA